MLHVNERIKQLPSQVAYAKRQLATLEAEKVQQAVALEAKAETEKQNEANRVAQCQVAIAEAKKRLESATATAKKSSR